MSTNIRFISTRFRNKKKREHPFTRRVKLIFPVFRVYAAWSKLNLDPKCKHIGHFLNSSLDVRVHSVSICASMYTRHVVSGYYIRRSDTGYFIRRSDTLKQMFVYT